jgi:hypothetical protein
MEKDKITHEILQSIIIPEWYNADSFIDYLCSKKSEVHHASNGTYLSYVVEIKLFTRKPEDVFEVNKEYDVCICYVNGRDTNYLDLLDYVHSLRGLLTGMHGAGVFYLLNLAPYNTQYLSLDRKDNLPEVDGHLIISRVCESDGHGCFYSSLSSRPFKDK